MAGKRTEKRDALKARLLAAARETIANEGLGGLKARDLAEKAGCATGTVYNVFADLDDLILQANTQTLGELGAALSGAVVAGDPGRTLKALALGYAKFARENRKEWDALFDHRMAHGGASPDWFLEGHSGLLAFLIPPLAELEPGLSEAERNLRARTYFAAVHGIVSISLQGRFLGLPEKDLDQELETLVDQLTKGMRAG